MGAEKGIKVIFITIYVLLITTQLTLAAEVANKNTAGITIISYNLAGPFGLSISLKDVFSIDKKPRVTSMENFGVSYAGDEKTIISHNGTNFTSRRIFSKRMENNVRKSNTGPKKTGIMLEFTFIF